MRSPHRSTRPIALFLGAWLCSAALMIVLGPSRTGNAPPPNLDIPRDGSFHREHGLNTKVVASFPDSERLDGVEDDDDRWKSFKPVKDTSSGPSTIRHERPSSSGPPPRILSASPPGSSTTRLRC